MKKIFMLSFFVIMISCKNYDELKYLKTISFKIDKDIYLEGFSDSDNPFLYYTANNTVYKYYFDTSKNDSIDLGSITKIKNFNKYSIIFKNEDFVVNQSFQVYNSVTNKIYYLDSLSKRSDLEFVLANNNVNSWDNNQLLINNWFVCDLYNNIANNDVMNTFIKCEQLNKTKPSYSIIDFQSESLELSSLTYKEIKPDTKDNTAGLWFKTSSIFIGDDIIYNNNFSNTVYKIDTDKNVYKIIDIKSKYTSFNEVEIYNTDDIQSKIKNVINYSTQINDILYDKYRNKILIIIVHGTEDLENNGVFKDTNRPFSILVYNENYVLENEFLFDSFKHDFNNVYVCKEGLIINANNKLSNNYEPQKLIYEIFSY